MGSKYRVFALLCALFFLSGCTDLVPQFTDETDVPARPNRFFRIELASHEPCELRVITHEPGQDGEITLTVWADDGILVDSQPKTFTMFANETHEDRIRCQVNADAIKMAGRYEVFAQAVMQGTSFKPISSTMLEVGFVDDIPTVLDSAENEWPNNLPFKTGSSQFDYAFTVSSDDPSSGYYVIRANGVVPDSAPQLILKTSSSVTFSEAQKDGITRVNNNAVQVIFPQIALKESRIALVQVQALDGVAVGSYAMRVMHALAPDSPFEDSPVGIAVSAISAETNTRRLSSADYKPALVDSFNIAAPTSTPSTEPGGPFVGGGGNSQIKWDATITDFSGTREEAFKSTFEHGLTQADWEWFKVNVGIHNPELEADDWQFLEWKTYYMPYIPKEAQ